MIANSRARKSFDRKLRLHLQNLHQLVEHVSASSMPVPGMYPCECLSVAIRLCTKFPPGVSDAYPTETQLEHNHEWGNVSLMEWPPKNFGERDIKAALVPFVQEIDNLLEKRLAEFGCVEYGNRHPWTTEGEDGVSLLVPFPGEDESEYGHFMSDGQERRFEEENGRPPFSDEAWIIDRYEGVGFCRSAMFYGNLP